MKDYFDLWILLQHSDFDGQTLCQAVQATFVRRKSALTRETPMGLSDASAQDAQKQAQWRAFLRKNQLGALALSDVVTVLRAFMLPIIKATTTDMVFSERWLAGGPWSPVDRK